MQVRNGDVVLLVIVSLAALGANLPEGMMEQAIDRNLLLVTLVVTVVISLFRHLRLLLFLSVSILAIGANLPEQLAVQLGISQPAMIVASGLLVAIALLYKLHARKPVVTTAGRAEEPLAPAPAGAGGKAEFIAAIRKGDLVSLHQHLISGVDVNFIHDGKMPLFLAIEHGYADIVLLLLSHGADHQAKSPEGWSPVEYAISCDQSRIAEIIRYAARQSLALPGRAAGSSKQKDNEAILFADICGSTALYDQLGNEQAIQIITRTLQILIREVGTYHGTVIKTIGDEIMCSFPSSVAAARAACAMQYCMDSERPGGDQPIYVRIGFHYGEVIHRADDAFGDTVNIAARVTSITRAGQIMTTQEVVNSLSKEFAGMVRPIMRSPFRGKQESFAIFQILWEPDNTVYDHGGQPEEERPTIIELW